MVIFKSYDLINEAHVYNGVNYMFLDITLFMRGDYNPNLNLIHAFSSI